MKIKNISVCIILLILGCAQPAYSLTLTEPAGTEKLAKEIKIILQEIGLEDLYKEFDENNKKETFVSRVEKSFEENLENLPDKKADYTEYLRNLQLSPQDKSTLKMACSTALANANIPGINDPALLAFIIEQIIINELQNNLLAKAIDMQNNALDELQEENIFLEDLPRLYNLSLYMCSCKEAPTERRIALILFAVTDIKKSTPIANEIVITGQNSDTTLMEYLIVRALQFLGYKKITLNIIDQVYRKLQTKTTDENSILYLTIEGLSKNLNKSLNIYPNAKIQEINLFATPFEYQKLCKEKTIFKSNILVTADAVMSGILPEIAKATVGKSTEATEFRQVINRVNIQLIDFENKDTISEIIIYLPTYSKPRIYWDRLLLSNDDETINEIKKQVENIATRLEPIRQENINAYRKQFIDAAQEEILPKLYNYANEQTIHAKNRIRQEAKIRQQQQMEEGFTEEIEELSEEEVQRRLADSFRIYKNKGLLKLTYKMDPYLVFEELVHDTLKDNGVAFMLGTGLLVQVTKSMVTNKPYISIFEQEGDQEVRCILRSKEFVEQQL